MSAVLNRFRLFGNRHINSTAPTDSAGRHKHRLVSAGASSRACFSVESAQGCFALSIEVQGVQVGMLSDVEHAIYLGAIERQINAIEQWLECRVEIAPIAATAMPPVTARMIGADKNTCVRLHASAQVLIDMPLFPGETMRATGMRMEWYQQAVQIQLAHYRLDAADALIVDEGSVLLMPSPEKSQPALLQLHEAQLPGRFNTATFTWVCDSKAPQQSAPICSSSLQTDDFFVAAKLLGSAVISSEQLLNLNNVTNAIALADSNHGTLPCQLLLDTGANYNGQLARVAQGAAFFAAVNGRVDAKSHGLKG